MRNLFFATILASGLVFSAAARADTSGYCDGNTWMQNAYCEGMAETACEMNTTFCTWFRDEAPDPTPAPVDPAPESSGYCDGNTWMQNAYCEGMNETACEMNSTFCTWFR